MRAIKLLATPLTFLILLTVATRLTFAAIESQKIPHDQLARAVFQTETGSVARSLAQEKGFASPYERESGPTAILPPVYPLIVAAAFKIFGIQSAASFYFLVALNIAFAALTCIPLHKIALRLGGISTTSVALSLWAFFPNGIVIPFEWIWETSLSALLATTLLWLTLEIAESPRLGDWLLYGLVWGCSLMTNSALGAALPIFLLWLLWQNKSAFPKRLARPTLALTVALLCCLPWTVRNFERFRGFIPLRSGFPFELYIGNNENYAPPFVYPPRISFEREQLRYLHMGEVPFMDEEKRKAYTFIHAHPRIFASLTLNRAEEFWIGLIHPFDAWRTHPAPTDRLFLLTNLLAPLLAAGGAILLLAHRHRFSVPLLAFPLAYPLVYYITHASVRYRHPLDPVLFLFAAYLVSSLASAWLKNQQPARGGKPK